MNAHADTVGLGKLLRALSLLPGIIDDIAFLVFLGAIIYMGARTGQLTHASKRRRKQHISARLMGFSICFGSACTLSMVPGSVLQL